MNECPECGTLVTEYHAVCPACGHDVRQATRSCARCKETIAADADTCPACGHLAEPGQCDAHPDREAPGRCALCGTALCDECESGDGRHHLCQDHARIPLTEGWAQLLSLPDEVGARLIEENLRAEGIDARMMSQKDHFAIPVEFGDLAKVRILVPSYAYTEASRVVESHRDAAGEVGFGCPNCGEPSDEGETECSACGEALV